MVQMTNAEKHQQILKEVKATFVLIAIVAAWHIGFGFLLEDIDKLILGMPLWFFVSTIGAFVISVIGVIILIKKVFKNFELGDELDEISAEQQSPANPPAGASALSQEGGDLND